MNKQKLMIPIDEVKVWEDNPREISDKDFQSLKRKIDKWNLWRPFLVWESKKQIIGGNMRYRACKELGFKEIWVEFREPKDEAEALEMAIADNESSGEWVESKLLEQINLYTGKIELDDFKITLDSLSLGSLKVDEVETSNKEIDPESLGTQSAIIFRYEHLEYLNLIELLQNAQEKLECDTNEEVLIKLLEPYV